MNAEFEKYIEGLSPELQEKARACKTKEELNAFIAENELELPEDALEAVAGGCGTKGNQGEESTFKCIYCNSILRFYDTCYFERHRLYLNRYYCANEKCLIFNNGLLYVDKDGRVIHY